MKTDRSRFQEAHFSTGVFKNPEATNEDVFNIFEKEIQELLQNFKNNESNWRVQRVISPDIHHVESQLFGESSYVWLCWDRKEDINKNEDEEYFRWCILRHLNPFQSNPLRIWLERWGGSVGFLWDWISNILGYSDGVISPRRLNSDEHENTEPPPHLQQWREEALMPYQTHDQTSFISNFRSKWSSSLLHEMSEFLRKSWGKVRTHRNLPRTWASHCPQAWWWKREIKKHEPQDASSICLLCWFRIFHRGDWNLRKKNQKRVLQMNMRNTGLQDIASSLQARERKRSLIWSQSWDTKGLKIKILQNNSSFILGKV